MALRTLSTRRGEKKVFFFGQRNRNFVSLLRCEGDYNFVGGNNIKFKICFGRDLKLHRSTSIIVEGKTEILIHHVRISFVIFS